jgi:large subunit ribosomal protein L29
MYASDIRQLNDSELLTKFLELREEIFTLRFQLATGSLEKHNIIPQLKKDIARVETVMRERELESHPERSEGSQNDGKED